MNSVYTTTITREAERRGITVSVLDDFLPVFVLRHRGREVRCFNSLTDRVGAATFHLAQNKRAAHNFLERHGFPVPRQELFCDGEQAIRFLRRHKKVVVKPACQWGGRGVSVSITTPDEIRKAVRFARRYEEDVLLEEQVDGDDYRLIFVGGRYVAAILRTPAVVVGNGKDSIRALIAARNRVERRTDPSHRIPLDRETWRTIESQGLSWHTVPKNQCAVRVRRTSNYHTGGDVEIVTDRVPVRLIEIGRRIVRLLDLPVVGVDFLVKGSRIRVLELSPDLAISPPEGYEVARRFIDYLFPDTRSSPRRRGSD